MAPPSKHYRGHRSQPKTRRHSPTPSSSTPPVHIFLKPPSSNPLKADFQALEDWHTTHKSASSNGRNTISEKFLKSKLPVELWGETTEVELIWRKDETLVYWIGKFHIEHNQRTDIKFGSDVKPYIPEVSSVKGGIDTAEVPAITASETETTTEETHMLAPVNVANPTIHIAAIIFLAWVYPEIAVTAIKILGILGIFALLFTSGRKL